jgi:hypothetical protein
MTSGGECIPVDDRYIRIYYNYSDESFPFVENLYFQPRRNLADSRINELARLDIACPECKADFSGGLEEWQNVWNDGELLYTLDDDLALVFSPFPVCKIAVDRFVHISLKNF